MLYDAGLPIFDLFKSSPTFFSYESGEIALSILTRTRPVNMRCDYEQTRKSWLASNQMSSATHDAHVELKRTEKSKAFRTIGKLNITIFVNVSSLDDAEGAVILLTKHFDEVIDNILEGVHLVLPPSIAITGALQRRRKRNIFLEKTT